MKDEFLYTSLESYISGVLMKCEQHENKREYLGSLADKNRLAVIYSILKDDKSLEEIATEVDMNPKAVEKSLNELDRFGFTVNVFDNERRGRVGWKASGMGRYMLYLASESYNYYSNLRLNVTLDKKEEII